MSDSRPCFYTFNANHHYKQFTFFYNPTKVVCRVNEESIFLEDLIRERKKFKFRIKVSRSDSIQFKIQNYLEVNNN